ncbi:hypothetical protein QF035_002278 [Streptomyces umbrinus]|uniref:Uncharacterized protein n=1 Tax=Streptomyces umbrinus TaxID=67370 RepID=A0ABU0SMA7_9ACTN|nr:hypothetical protein [Streptomyces umbrinus]
MPGSRQPQRPLLVHQLLGHAHALLATAEEDDVPSLTALLVRAADHLPVEDRGSLDPLALAWLVADSAAHLLACTRTPVRPEDPHLDCCLQALDRLPRSARTCLLEAAVRRTAPDPDDTPPPTTARFQAPVSRPAARRGVPGRCPCPCNSGGFCGGCGHAGCGGRR